MPIDIDLLELEQVDAQNTLPAPRTILAPNFNRIRQDILLLATAINTIQPGAINPEDLSVNGSAFSGFLTGAGDTLNLQQLANAIDDRNGSNLSLNVSDLNNTLDGFRTQAGAKNVQSFMEYCDNALQPLITVVPSISGFRVNFATVQPNGFNLFTSLTELQRSFNATIAAPDSFTRFELRASGNLLLSNIPKLPGTTINQLFEAATNGSTNWNTAVATHGGTDSEGRTTVELALIGYNASNEEVARATTTLTIGVAAQPETLYYQLSTDATPIDNDVSSFTAIMATNNPATLTFNVPTIAANTDPVYLHMMIPASFDAVRLQQVTALGTFDAASYFSNFTSPASRNIGSPAEAYNVYVGVELVPTFNGQFSLRVEDTS